MRYPGPMTHDLPAALVLERSSNLRDLGGWPTLDGRRVRTGLVYRAPALTGLSEADLAAVAALGIRTSCDFRGKHESFANPVELAGVTVRKLPIEPSVGGSLRDILLTGEATGHTAAADMLGLLRDAYQAYALVTFERYRTLFELILGADNLPLLFHCSAGKDRTGFGAALLLRTLGVGWDHVMQDYLATNRLWRRESAAMLQLPEPMKEVLLTAHPELLTAAFNAIDAEYGTLEFYLSEAIGLNANAVQDLKAKLLV